MLNKDQLFKKGVVLVMGEKHCIVMMFDFKAKEILMCRANMLKCQVHK